MSLDIDWSLLSDAALTSGIVDAFNRYLATADRPSFLGPISVGSFDFGTQAPDVEVVGLGDVYPDFLEADEDGGEIEGEEDADEGGSHDSMVLGVGMGGGSRWQDGMSSAAGGGRASRGWSGAGSHPTLGAQPPFQDVFGRGTPSQQQQQSYSAADDSFSAAGGRARSSGSAFNQPPRTPFTNHRPYLAGMYTSHSPFPSRVGLSSALPTPMATPFISRNPSYASIPHAGVSRGGSPSSHLGAHDVNSTPPDERPPPPPPSASGVPSLQLHVRVHHQADIRFSLQTTLLINHPSPAFMSLPLTLTITEVEVDWHLVLAYQAESERPSSGSRQTQAAAGRRVHLSILDPLDPYGPPAPGTTTPPPIPHLGENKTPPAGERLIPRMSMESSIGQEGERVLRNVAKVERFVLNLIRKMIVDELVFPNFQTIAL